MEKKANISNPARMDERDKKKGGKGTCSPQKK